MGFEPTICGGSLDGSPPIVDWYEFDKYLTQSFHERTAREYQLYAKRHWQVLTSGDASPLLGLSDSKRLHAMSALSALANFTGEKDRWKQIVSKYGLKWNGKNDLGDLVGLLYSNRFSDMLSELRVALETIPSDYGNYFRFNMLVGLRPSESVQAVNILRTSPEYLNRDFMILEHYRFPRLFIRGTKKAFISVVDAETLEIAKATRSLDYQGIRSEFRRRKQPWLMRYCRKLFATHMHKHFDTELVDLLQGRVPSSIFARYYNRPNYRDELERVRATLPELRKLL